MTLRRYTEMRKSAGTSFPPLVRIAIFERDSGCLGRVLGWPGDCFGALEADHIRASGAVGMKSRSTLDNGATLCSTHHRYKTEHGRECRPRLLDWIANHGHHVGLDHDSCVDPCTSTCKAARAVVR